MGRHVKVGLDYFFFDVYSDNKLKLIEADFGLKGFAVIVKLWQKIYAERGYYCEFDEDAALLFADSVRLGKNAVSEIVRAAIKRGIFDGELYDKYKILTSHGIQKRYMDATDKRVRVDVDKRYLLLSEPEINENVHINGISDNINAISDGRNTQSRVDKSRVDKIIVDKRREKETARPRGTYKHILLTDKQYEDLTSEFGDKAVDDYISRVDEYCESSGKTYSNYAATISRWIKADREKEKRESKFNNSKFNNYQSENDYADLEERLLAYSLMEDGE